MKADALPHCSGSCHQGRTACSCSTIQQMPAEACTELGANTTPPLHQHPAIYILAPLFERWPRFAGLALAVVIVALCGLAGEPLLEVLPSDPLIGDGFPAELLAQPHDTAQAASGVQP